MKRRAFLKNIGLGVAGCATAGIAIRSLRTSDQLSLDTIRAMKAALADRQVLPHDGNYYGLVHPDDVDYKRLLASGHVGRYEGCRFIEQTQLPLSEYGQSSHNNLRGRWG